MSKCIKKEQECNELIQQYPVLWRSMIDDWKKEAEDYRMWIMFCASLLFSTKGMRWAIDPVCMFNHLGKDHDIDLTNDLKDLSLVLFSHNHGDHFDIHLINQLSHLPIQWIVPDHMLELVSEVTKIPPKNIITAKNQETIQIEKLRIFPFNGLHSNNVECTGYLIEIEDKRLLFPNDVREYNAAALPSFGPVDILFANLWLGRESALLPNPPQLDAFCQFCHDLQPKTIVMAHLYEVKRTAADCWLKDHATRVENLLLQKNPDLKIIIPQLGEGISFQS